MLKHYNGLASWDASCGNPLRGGTTWALPALLVVVFVYLEDPRTCKRSSSRGPCLRGYSWQVYVVNADWLAQLFDDLQQVVSIGRVTRSNDD